MNGLKRWLAVTIFSVISVVAQDRPTTFTGATAATNGTAPRFGSGLGARSAARFDRTLEDLTPEQKIKVEEANKEFSSTTAPLYFRLVTARRELENTVDQDKVDETGVRAKAKDIADLEAEIAIARAHRYVKLRAFLTPDQARRFNQPTPMGRPFQPPMREGQAPSNIAPNK